MTYQEKLRDPRWQKKRLEILSRDKWACTKCGNNKKSLQVHHEKYVGDPWDAPNHKLKTLCEDCHKGKHVAPQPTKEQLLATIAKSKENMKDAAPNVVYAMQLNILICTSEYEKFYGPLKPEVWL